MNHGTLRVVRNSVFLYFRMAVLMIVSLYMTRVVLRVLGSDGYGLYNVVGGIVAIFASMKILFSTSVQRYLNYYKGKGDEEATADVFNIGLFIHIILSLIFGICVEIIGLYLIHYKLNIPSYLFESALFVFHCSVVTACVTIITIPYDAVIIANEKMGIYAVISIFDGLLKLVIAISLPWIPYDKLCTYAFLLCMLSVLIRFVYSFYCRKFPECRTTFKLKKKLFKDLVTFSSWNFLGNLGFSLMNEGINILLNMFGGVVVNSARAISYQIRTAVADVSSNFTLAANPRIVQNSAHVSVVGLYPQILELGRITFYITLFLTTPLYIFLPFILNIWLGDVPPLTVEFTRYIFIYLVVRSFHSSIDTLFKAYGCIKKYQIWDIITLLFNIPTAYIILKMGGRYEWVFLSFSVWECVNLIAILIIAQSELSFPCRKYLSDISQLVLPSILAVSIIAWLFLVPGKVFVQNHVFSSLVITLLYVVILMYFTSNQKERKFCFDAIVLFLNKVKK